VTHGAFRGGNFWLEKRKPRTGFTARGRQTTRLPTDPVVRCQLRPGAGKNPLLKNRPCRASACRVFTSIKCLSAGTLGLLPRLNLKAGVSFTLRVVPDSQQIEWPPLPVPAKISEFLSLSLQLSARRIKYAPRKFMFSFKQTQCQ
jgi:hypothetical protein